ncbi:MAG: undecaprenyl-diphosphate phosphatase [Rhodospirillaceae bacterium]
MPGIAQLIVVAALSIAHIAPLGGAAHYSLFRTFEFGPDIANSVVYLAVSVGLLAAMLAYFCVDLWEMGAGLVRAAKGKRDPAARLAAQLVAATVLVASIVFALPFLDFEFPAPTPTVIGWSAVIGGAFLLLFDRASMTIKRLEHASFIDMFVVALAQVIAFLVPGVSRSSITMTFARALGYERVHAARFSMLLGIPAMAGWCVLQAMELARDDILFWRPWLLAVGGVSFFAGLITLAIMMEWLRRRSFAPFAIYRVLIGAVILVWQNS